MGHRFGFQSVMSFLLSSQARTLVAIYTAACIESASADNGYAALGYLTYSTFDSGGSVNRRHVMMFEVCVLGPEWRIRTEPVLEGMGGPVFYEFTHSVDGTMVGVTGLESARESVVSPFKELRAELQRSMKEDVYFTNALQNRFSVALQAPGLGGKPAPSAKGEPKPINNVATATVLKGGFPPADPSFAALLWFALAPPIQKTNGTNGMLLQVWDDGNPNKTRFRYATWNHFAEPPYLVSTARFSWKGMQLLPNGDSEVINVSDVANPLGVAAQYEAGVVTNLSGIMVPLRFKLTRFRARTPANETPKISSTVDASVVRIRRSGPHDIIEVGLPGKTFFNDYRLSSGELMGRPINYVGTNPPQGVSQLKQSRLYEATLAAAKISASKTPKPYLVSTVRIFFVFSLAVSLIILIYLRKRGQF